MAYVTYLKRGEGLKINGNLLILEAVRGAKIVLEVGEDDTIQKLTEKDLKNARIRKAPILPKQEQEKKT